MACEAELLRLTGKYVEYANLLLDLQCLVTNLDDYNLKVWTVSRLCEHYSLIGQHGKAMEVLLGFGLMPAQWPAELWATNGVIERRRGDLIAANASLDMAARMLRDAGNFPALVRVLLHLAATTLSQGYETVAVNSLREALSHMLRLKQLHLYRPDLEEHRELLHFAMLEPDLAPYMNTLQDQVAILRDDPRLPEDAYMHLRLFTLGVPSVLKNGQEVKFSIKAAPMLLAYLAMNPGKTRMEMQLELFPDKDAATGSAYVRKAIQDIRDKLGLDVIHHEGPHFAPWYRLHRQVRVDLDYTELMEAIDKGELARSLSLYRGEFFPEVDNEWVTTLREQALLALTFELRAQMARYKADGDFRRFILLANQYLRADPYDREVLEARVDAAKIVAGPQELARYVAELHRMYN